MRWLLPLLWITTAALGAEYHGRLDPTVSPGTRVLAAVVPAGPELIALLPAAPAAGEQVWAPKRPFSIKGKTYALALVASPSGARTLWVDVNGDGKFGPGEAFAFTPQGADLSLPWENGIYHTFPVHFALSTDATRGAPPPVPTPTLVTALVYNFNIEYTGSVQIEGKSMKVWFYPSPAVVKIDPTTIRTSLDLNFNGEVDSSEGEMDTGHGHAPVFHSGSHYLAVKSVDLATGELVIEERPASDYTRFDAQPGQVMPAFSFTDLRGAKHQLSDLHGNYVLLDFWGTWCGPCIEEMRHMDPLYAKYHARGLEIISMDMEKTAGKLTPEEYAAGDRRALAFVTKAGHPWLMAGQASIERLALDVIHVNSYPTCILLGPDGKVISREARGEVLEQLLAKAYP